MKRNLITGVVLVLTLAISLPALAGGGWTKKKGEGYFKLGQSSLRATKFFEADGSTVDIVTTGVYFTSLYGEYGLSDRWTTTFYVPFFSRVTVNKVEFTSGRVIEGDDVNTIGDSDIGLKYGIIRNKPFVLAGSLTLGLPLGTTSGGRTEALQTGDGEFNQLFQLEAGYGFQKAPVFLSGGVGFNNRTKGFSEEFRYNAEVGLKVKKKLLLIGRVAGVESFKNGDPVSTANGLFSNNLEYVAVGSEVAYELNDNLGFAAGFSSAVSGSLILAANTYSGGIYIKM